VERINKQITQRCPSTTIENEALFIAFRLAKAGYYNGDPQKILKAPIDIIIGILNYEAFEMDLKEAWNEIIEEGK